MANEAMEDIVDANDIVAEAIMMRAAEDQCLLLVEGHSDKKILSRYMDSRCDIVVCNGREFALTAIRDLTLHGLTGVLCIVDADFEHQLGLSVANDNVIVTDENDFDIVMQKSQAFERVIAELGSSAKIAAFENAGGSARTLVRDLSHEIGVLRYISKRDGLNLTFNEVKFKCISRSMKLSNVELVKEIKNKSQKPDLSIEKVCAEIDKIRPSEDHDWRYCCGHDVAMVFGKALQSVLGNLNIVNATGPIIEGYFRVSFSEADFLATSIFLDIREWEQRNPDYVCLKPHLAA